MGAMTTIAVYNMKGGVGKTTTAVNLSFAAATAGHRTLVWDLDPQAASSFAFRVRPRVSEFTRKSLENGDALTASIKETDYPNLHLLPADFAYRKFERFLDSLGRPERVFTSLLAAIGREFDTVVLDCPAGFSLLTQGVLAAADVVAIPTIPTVLSLRTVVRMIKWAEYSDAPPLLSPFFSMVDRRKALHRRISDWSISHPEFVLSTQVPYASIVEQMAIRRMPLALFAARDPATSAFAEIWMELQARLRHDRKTNADVAERRARMLLAFESLIGELEPTEREADSPPRIDRYDSRLAKPDDAREETGVDFVHRFDTERLDLERGGHRLELRERKGGLFLIVRSSGDVNTRALAQIDSSWAVRILSGEMSPLAALEQRLGRPGPHVIEHIRSLVGGQALRRVETRSANHPGRDENERRDARPLSA